MGPSPASSSCAWRWAQNAATFSPLNVHTGVSRAVVRNRSSRIASRSSHHVSSSSHASGPSTVGCSSGRGGSLLGAVLPQLSVSGDVQVFIGDENPAGALRQFGVVVATYGIDGEATGILGVLGPTRMSYSRSISSVRYMARLMSDLMEDLYSSA